jgi:hypothetical protein
VTDERDEFDEPVRMGNLLWLPDEHTFEDLDPVGTWRHRLELARRRGDTEEVERRLRTGPPPGYGPAPSTFAPVILALEVGGDPAGAIAVALAARLVKNLALVIVMGGPKAARFTRHLLDLMGRNNVAVVASSAPSIPDAGVAELVPAEVSAQPTDVPAAIRTVTGRDPYLVIWGNSGPLTDLAAALQDDPGLANRLRADVAAGPFDAPTPQFASDPGAAAFALATIRTPPVEAHHPDSAVSPPFPPTLLTVDPTRLDVGPASPLYQRLTEPDAPTWAALLGRDLDRWFTNGNPSSSQYASLMIAAVLSSPLIDSSDNPVVADETGRIRIDPAGVVMETTDGLRDYFIEFRTWLDNQIREAIAEG